MCLKTIITNIQITIAMGISVVRICLLLRSRTSVRIRSLNSVSISIWCLALALEFSRVAVTVISLPICNRLGLKVSGGKIVAIWQRVGRNIFDSPPSRGDR